MADRIIPLRMSADSKLNAHYHYCQSIGQSRAYAACLARLEGRLDDNIDCANAIRRKTCPAIDMRQKEELAGQALFFIERTAVEKFLNKVRGWVMPVLSASKPAEERTVVKPTAKPKKASLLDAIEEAGETDYASLVNDALKQHQAKKPVAPAQKIDLLPGETPLQAFKRMKGQQ